MIIIIIINNFISVTIVTSKISSSSGRIISYHQFTNKLAVSSLIPSIIIHKSSSVGASLLAPGCIGPPILQRLSEACLLWAAHEDGPASF